MTCFLGDIRNCFNIKLYLYQKVHSVYYSKLVYTLPLFFSLPFLQIGHRGQPYVNDTKVKSFIRWIKTKTDSGEMKNTVIGGYYPYPPVPETFSKYSTSVKGTNKIDTF